MTQLCCVDPVQVIISSKLWRLAELQSSDAYTAQKIRGEGTTDALGQTQSRGSNEILMQIYIVSEYP